METGSDRMVANYTTGDHRNLETDSVHGGQNPPQGISHNLTEY